MGVTRTVLKGAFLTAALAAVVTLSGCGSQTGTGNGGGRATAPSTTGTGNGTSGSSSGGTGSGGPRASTGGTGDGRVADGVTLDRNGLTSTAKVGGGTVSTNVQGTNVRNVIIGNTELQTSTTVRTGTGSSVTVNNRAPTNTELFADIIVNGQANTKNRREVIVTDRNGRSTNLTQAKRNGEAVGNLINAIGRR